MKLARMTRAMRNRNSSIAQWRRSSTRWTVGWRQRPRAATAQLSAAFAGEIDLGVHQTAGMNAQNLHGGPRPRVSIARYLDRLVNSRRPHVSLLQKAGDCRAR